MDWSKLPRAEGEEDGQGSAAGARPTEPACWPPADSLWDRLSRIAWPGRRVRRWAVGVVTSACGRATLAATVDGLLRAGWAAPYLFLDGTVRVPERLAHLPGVLREPPVGPWPHYYLALAELTM